MKQAKTDTLTKTHDYRWRVPLNYSSLGYGIEYEKGSDAPFFFMRVWLAVYSQVSRNYREYFEYTLKISVNISNRSFRVLKKGFQLNVGDEILA